MPFMHYVSAFGDSSLLLILSGLLALVLHRRNGTWGAVLWLRSVLLCVISTAAVKVAGYTLAAFTPPMPVAFTSLSGHAAFATLFYTGLGTTMRPCLPAWARIASYATVVCVIGAVALSRILLGAHTTAEVLSGVALGLVFAVGFARRLDGTAPLPRFNTRHWVLCWTVLIMAGAIKAALLLHAWTPEELFQLAGATLAGTIGSLP